MIDHVLRMVVEAEDRIHDAELIGQSLCSQSDSQALLKVLALEVLLKALLLKTTGAGQQSHRYIDLWAKLPEGTRSKVLEVARARYPGHADLTNIEKLLCVYEYIFKKARYGYEIYEGMSLVEQAQLGEDWRARGAPTNEADIQYFPLELSALLEGMLHEARSAA